MIGIKNDKQIEISAQKTEFQIISLNLCPKT